VKNASLPFLVVGNKLDLVSKETVAKVQAELGQEFPVMSLLTGENVPSVIEEIERRFPQGSRIIVLGFLMPEKRALSRG
jgi:tRNA U34 5-carboxymethylaminomethyl modifying GTPase MnmE/TrmE